MLRNSTQYSADQELAAAHAMTKHGGSFAASIGHAYFLADLGNRERLVTAFADLFEKYRNPPPDTGEPQ